MFEEGPNLVVYEKLYSFLQTLQFSATQDRQVVEKLLELYKSDPERSLSLINTLLASAATNEAIQQLAPELEQTVHAQKPEVPLIFYSN